MSLQDCYFQTQEFQAFTRVRKKHHPVITSRRKSQRHDLLPSLFPSLPPESLLAHPVVFYCDRIQSRDIQWQSLLECRGVWQALRTPVFGVELAIVILSEWNFIRSLSVCSEEKRSFYTVLVMEWKIAFPPHPNSAISGEADCLQRAGSHLGR